MKSLMLQNLAVAAVMALSACAIFKSKKPTEPTEKPKFEAPQLIGRIASIPADKRFVLIQSYGTDKIETGAILTTRGPENRTANLLATGESLGQFTAADLQSGSVEVGDAVYSHHTPPLVPSSAEPAPPAKPPEH